MAIPTNQEILIILDQLDSKTADELENEHLEFKPWADPKKARREVAEIVVCFANADGGVIILGVSDKTVGRSRAIHGVKDYSLDRWKTDLFTDIQPHLVLSIEELPVPEGTGTLLMVRVPKGNPDLVYGTSQGIYKTRVGKSCMPLNHASWMHKRITTGALDWSGELAIGVKQGDLDPIEIARARAILRSKNPESKLLETSEANFLKGLEAARGNQITNAGLVLFGKPEVLAEVCPQSQVHYVQESTETEIARNDVMRASLLQVLERIEQIFEGPANPEEELSIGLFKMRIPAYPLEAVREAILNALSHRDFSNPGEVLIRHTPYQLVVISPGGFMGGITLQNILRHEPVARNRTLTNALLRLRLVESAGVGRRRIFIPALRYGKRMPQYATDGHSVTLKLFNGSYDRAMAALVSRLEQEGKKIEMDGLMVLNYLRENSFIDIQIAAELLQLKWEEARKSLDQMSFPDQGILERKGHTKSATYHLTKGVARELLGKAAYTRSRGLLPIRYAEIVREYLKDHKSISNRECRELLGLGESPSAQVEASRYLARWSKPKGFLKPISSSSKRRYKLTKST
jgi:ATP-dependent DNA helicase RecG